MKVSTSKIRILKNQLIGIFQRKIIEKKVKHSNFKFYESHAIAMKYEWKSDDNAEKGATGSMSYTRHVHVQMEALWKLTPSLKLESAWSTAVAH